MKRSIPIMILAMILAGSSLPVTKTLTSRMPVFFANWLTLAFAWLVLVIPGSMQLFRWLSERKSRSKAASLYMVLLWPALQGLFGMALFRIFTFTGLKHINALEGGLLTATSPGIMGIMAFLLLREHPDRWRVAGILLAAAGIVILNFRAEGCSFPITGIFFILAAVTCEACLTIFRKMAFEYIPPLANTLLIISFCLLYLFPVVIIRNEFAFISVITQEQIAACIYLGVFTTSLAYICWGYAATRIDAGVTGILSTAMPLTAAILSIAVLREAIEIRHVWGGICILVSMYFGTIRKKGSIASEA